MLSISGTTPSGTVAIIFDPQGMPFKGFVFRNHSTAFSIWLNEVGGIPATAQPALEIRPGEEYITPPNCNYFKDTISVICSNAVPYTARVW